MAVACQMVAPAQPITGGQSVGSLAIAYNPHLEAGFDPGVFQVKSTINDNGTIIDNTYGVQTNCMSGSSSRPSPAAELLGRYPPSAERVYKPDGCANAG